MSWHKAETRTSRYHRHGWGCLDTFLGSFICAGDALLASAALLTGETLGRSEMEHFLQEGAGRNHSSCSIFMLGFQQSDKL